MTVRAVLTTIAMTLTLGGVSAQQAAGPSAEQAYRNRFMVAGFFLRAGNVCEADGRRLIDAAFNFLGSEEIKAVSKAFPNATEKWMTEGANGFNSTVIKDGIIPACESAVVHLQRIQETDERLRSSSSPAPAQSQSADRTIDPVNDPSRNSANAAGRARASAAAESAFRPQTRAARCKAIRQRHFEKWAPKTKQEYQENCWQLVEADNGAVFKVDLGSIQKVGTAASASIYSDEGPGFNPRNLRHWVFTCREHFKVRLENGRLSDLTYAPPRSVAAQMSNIVCAGAGIGLQTN